MRDSLLRFVVLRKTALYRKRRENLKLGHYHNIKDIGATCGFALRYFVWEVSATCDGSDDRLRQM